MTHRSPSGEKRAHSSMAVPNPTNPAATSRSTTAHITIAPILAVAYLAPRAPMSRDRALGRNRMESAARS